MIRNGVDIIEIDRLTNISPKIRERFINRVFTFEEQLICNDNNACLSGRFAAKEAVSKVLGTGIGEIHWKLEKFTGRILKYKKTMMENQF